MWIDEVDKQIKPTTVNPVEYHSATLEIVESKYQMEDKCE